MPTLPLEILTHHHSDTATNNTAYIKYHSCHNAKCTRLEDICFFSQCLQSHQQSYASDLVGSRSIMTLHDHHCPGRSGGRGGPALCVRKDDKFYTLRDGQKLRYCSKHQIVCPVHEAAYVNTTDTKIRCKQECRGCKHAREEEWKKERDARIDKALKGESNESAITVRANESAVIESERLCGSSEEEASDFWRGMSDDMNGDGDAVEDEDGVYPSR